MKRQVVMSSTILLVSLAVCCSSGCKKSNESGPEAGAGTEAGAASSSAAVNTAPADWPGDLPVFKGGQMTKVTKGGQANAFRGAIFTQIKNPENAFQQYKTALEGKGWVLDEDTSNDVTWAAAFRQGAKNLHVSVSKDGLMANLMYSAD